nr:hypothetical protein CFP56_77342 [Quercus suber]
MEFIAPAHMSHPGTPDTEVPNSLSNPNSIFSLFPPAKSLCSSDSSLSNQSLIPDLYDYPSISSFFPPDSSRSSSLSSAAETQHLSPYYIPSFFPPTHSQGNSISSETPPYGFAYSIPSIFQPNRSFSSSIESTHDHDRFITTELFHEHHKTCWLSINSDKIITVPQEVEEEFEQARREGWNYAMFWKKDWPGSPFGHNTISAVKRFYNGDYYELKTSWFLFTRLWPGSVIQHLFDTRKKWGPEDYLAAMNSKRACQGRKAGLKSMSWVPIANGVMEFGSTQLIDRHVTNKWFVNFDR